MGDGGIDSAGLPWADGRPRAHASIDNDTISAAPPKPLDTAFVADLARRCASVVTAENHCVIGGLGSSVAETLMELGVAAGFARVGLQDCFAQGGSTPYLFNTYGLSVEGILAALEKADARRGG